MDAPVLDLAAVRDPVIIASIELLRNGRNYLVRTRSVDGLEAITVPNPAIMAKAFPVFLRSVAPARSPPRFPAWRNIAGYAPRSSSVRVSFSTTTAAMPPTS